MPGPAPHPPADPPPSRAALEARLESGQSVEVPTLGQSMHPFLQDGDRVRIVAVAPASLRLGDVIAFWRGSGLVVHRFAGWAGPGLLREKGDNFRSWQAVPAGELLGRVDRVRRGAGERELHRPGLAIRNRLLGLRAWAWCLCFPPLRRAWHWLRRQT